MSDIAKMTVKQLKAELTSRELPTDGLKAALKKRLVAAIEAEEAAEVAAAAKAAAKAPTSSGGAQQDNGAEEDAAGTFRFKASGMAPSLTETVERPKCNGMPVSGRNWKKKQPRRCVRFATTGGVSRGRRTWGAEKAWIGPPRIWRDGASSRVLKLARPLSFRGSCWTPRRVV